MTIRRAIPHLLSADLDAAREFYAPFLGFDSKARVSVEVEDVDRLAAHSAKPRTEGYQAPAWTYGVDAAELASLPVRDLQRIPLPHGRGAPAEFWLPLVSRLPILRTALVTIYRARTIATSSSTTATPIATSTTASATNAAHAARDAVRATLRDA